MLAIKPSGKESNRPPGATLGSPTWVKVSHKVRRQLCGDAPASNTPLSQGANVAFTQTNQGSGPTGF